MYIYTAYKYTINKSDVGTIEESFSLNIYINLTYSYHQKKKIKFIINNLLFE